MKRRKYAIPCCIAHFLIYLQVSFRVEIYGKVYKTIDSLRSFEKNADPIEQITAVKLEHNK